MADGGGAPYGFSGQNAKPAGFHCVHHCNETRGIAQTMKMLMHCQTFRHCQPRAILGQEAFIAVRHCPGLRGGEPM